METKKGDKQKKQDLEMTSSSYATRRLKMLNKWEYHFYKKINQ